MNKTSRAVYVAIPDIQEALASKQDFDVLAFCLLVKLNLTNAEISNATYRRLKEVTHLGTERLRRIIQRGTETGRLAINNGKLVVNRISDATKGYAFRFKNKYAKRTKKVKLQFNLTLTQVKDMLRRAVVANHVRMVENIRETSLLTINPKNVREYRKGKRLLRRLRVWGFTFSISNRRFAEVANCSISKVRDVKRKMIERNELERKYNNTLVCDDAKQFDIKAYAKCYDDACFLFRDNGKVYKHNANSYDYKGNNIVRVLKKDK